MFCTAQDCIVLMFPTFLRIILDLCRILYTSVRGLRLLKFRCTSLIYCLSVYLLEMVRQHCPVGSKVGCTNDFELCMHCVNVRCFVCFLYVFLVCFFSLFCYFIIFSVYPGTIYDYIINSNK